MSTPKKTSFAERFEAIDTALPISKEEAKDILKEAGLDASESVKRLFAEFEEVESKERAERFAKADVAVHRERARLAGRNSDLSRPAVVAQLELLRTQHPGLSAHFRNFQSASDDELRSLLTELEELTSGAAKK